MATTGRIVYHGDDETIKKEKREFSLTDEIMELINSGGGGGGSAINGVKVNGQIVNPDQAGYVGLTIPGVINNLTSNSTSDALSAKQGKVLYEYIQALQHVGHFLALWNTATGLPVTNPETSPYTYNTGDYYIVSNIAAAGGTNYKPNGSSYTINVASTTVESGDVQVNDLYFYDGYERRLLDNSGGGSSIAVDSSLSTTSTNPVQNAVITNRLNQMALDANTKTFWLTNLQDTTTGQAIRAWVDGGGNAIVYYSGLPYFVTAKSATRITLYSKFTGTQNSPSNQSTGFTEQLMWIDNNNNTITITNTAVGLGAPYLATNQNYATAYVPQYDGSPATKKYVDDKFAAVPVYTAGSNIDITSNTISTIRNGYVYVTCTDGASVQHKTGTSAEGNYTPQEGDLIMVHFTQGCSVGGPDIAIDGGTAIPFYIGTESANAGNMYFGSTNVSKMFVYTNGRLVGDAVKDNNTLYSAGTGLALSNGVFSNTQPGPTVSATAPANPSEGDMWYDTTNDVLNVYNGSSWDDTLGSNIKLFNLSSTSDLTTAQAAYDFGASGGMPIIRYNGETFIPHTATFSGGNAPFWAPTTFSNGASYTVIDAKQLYLYASNGTVTQVNRYGYTSNTLSTGKNYTTPYVPEYAGSPATKKYVDDHDTIVSATAPSSPTEGMLWYDTANDVLKTYDGTNWNEVGGNTDTSNVKAFFLEDDEDTTGATEVLQRVVEGYSEEGYRYPIIYMGGDTYLISAGAGGGLRGTSTMTLRFVNVEPEKDIIGYSRTELSQDAIEISGTLDTDTFAVSNVTIQTETNILGDFLEAKAGGTYINPRTPAYDGDPTTKKYVDDTVGGAISKGTTAPSSPTEGQLWYDTTNDALKVYNGTAWVAVGGGGVSITDVTVTTAYGTAAKVGTTTAGNYTPTAGDFIMVNFVNGCSVASPTLNIDGSGAKNIRTGNASATTSTLALGTTSNSNIKMLMYYDGTYYRTWSTSNNTYSGMSQSTASTGTSTTSSLISAKVLNDTIVEKAITLDPNSPLTVTTIWAGTETQYNALSSKGDTTAYLCVED